MERKLNVTEFLHGGDYNPEQWLGTPEIIDQDFILFKRADINTVTVGVFSWAKLEPKEGVYDFSWLDNIFDSVEKMNGHVILATPSGARPAWLAQKYPEVLRTQSDGTKRGFGGRHNHCLTSPVYRQKVREINTKLAKHFGKRPSLVLWHISNEYSGECYCELCQQAFRDWLKRKYHTLDKLNHVWWNDFWSHTYSDWSQITAPSPITERGNKGMNLDWKRFVTDQTISFVDNEVAPLRQITPQIPVTTNMMAGQPLLDPFAGFDYQKLASHLDIISWDSYPAWNNDYQTTEKLAQNVSLIHDFFRSLKHKDFLVMESTPSKVNWQDFNRAKAPGIHELASLQDIAHGSNSVLYFQLRQSRGGAEMFHGAVLEHRHPAETRVFKDVMQVGKTLQKIKDARNSEYIKAKVAIMFSYENFWALNDAESFAKKKRIWQTIQKHYRYFYEHDIPVDFVSPDDDWNQYELIIDPMHFMMSQKYIDNLCDYVKSGGHVVGTYISGVVNENALAYMNEWPQGLQQIYGIEPQETDVLYPSQKNKFEFDGKIYQAHDFCEILNNRDAQVLARYQSDFYHETAAITKHKYGRGMGYYIACRADYTFCNQFYDELTKELNLDLKLPIIKASSKISIQVRTNKKIRYIFVQNFSHQANDIDLLKNMKELLSEKIENGRVTLKGYESKIYELKM